MDPYFRQRHGSGPSPHDDSSPHSVTSQYRNQFAAASTSSSNHTTQNQNQSHNHNQHHHHNNNNNALEHLLQSPQDLKSAFSRFNNGTTNMDSFSNLVNNATAGGRQEGGFDAFQYAQPQASTSSASVQQQPAPTGKRGSKACVACELCFPSPLQTSTHA